MKFGSAWKLRGRNLSAKKKQLDRLHGKSGALRAGDAPREPQGRNIVIVLIAFVCADCEASTFKGSRRFIIYGERVTIVYRLRTKSRCSRLIWPLHALVRVALAQWI